MNLNERRQTVIDALRQIFDPELPVNIYDLGLIYTIELPAWDKVHIQMTLTTPACPVAHTFPEQVQRRLFEIPDMRHVKVELVWTPPWSSETLPPEVKLQLGLL